MFEPSSTEANPIHLQILKDQMMLTTQVLEFQESVRTNMQKKYSWNHNVVTFQPGEIVTIFCIPKENLASTNNHRLICMVKDIPHDGRHLLQTKFRVLDRLYLT